MARRGRRPGAARTVGLHEWTIVLDAGPLPALAAAGLGDGELIVDPWGIPLRVSAAA